VAKELGENIKKYCPNCKHVVIIFNPADITGLVTLLYSGLKPNQVSTLAALDSTRLQSALAKHFGIQQAAVKNCCTYGGHGEQMAVFASPVTVDGTPLLDIIGTGKAVNGKTLSKEEWAEMKKAVTQGGAAIIKLRGRSSFQSPAYVSVEMIAAAMGGKDFAWPAGTYVNTEKYHHIMMAMPSIITADGTYTKAITGTAEELADLDKSYEHLCALRDQVIGMGVLPAVSEWSKVNPNL
jgi:malate dehydrogenase